MSYRTLQIGTVPGLWPPTWPMGLTMLRLLLLPVFLWVLVSSAHRMNQDAQTLRWTAVGIFALMAVTDKLDGYLARRLKQISKIGTLLDPVADKLLIACSVILLSLDWAAPRGFDLPWGVVAAVYGKDLLLALGALTMLSLVGKVTITPRFWGRCSTVLQLGLVIATLIGPELRKAGEGFAYGLTRGLWWAVVLVAVGACGDYFLAGWRQFVEAKRQGPGGGVRGGTG